VQYGAVKHPVADFAAIVRNRITIKKRGRGKILIPKIINPFLDIRSFEGKIGISPGDSSAMISKASRPAGSDLAKCPISLIILKAFVVKPRQGQVSTERKREKLS